MPIRLNYNFFLFSTDCPHTKAECFGKRRALNEVSRFRRVIDAFGLDRCLWGTDWTRTIKMLTYEQGVAPFRATKRLSENDKSALMGGTLQKVYKW